MRRTMIQNAPSRQRTTFQKAEEEFYKRCKMKNLRQQTLTYYAEDLTYFRNAASITYADEITQRVYDDFIFRELEAGKKTVSLNTRIRGLRVFFKFCAEREYMEPIDAKLMKVDEEIKEPYSDTELQKLLERPQSNRWAAWRTWAAINYLVSTGNRAGTVVNLKIEDLDFDALTIRLRQVKNRRQQIIPMSPALKDVLLEYLNTWTWTQEDFLFPSYEGGQLNLRSFQGSISRYNTSRGVYKTSVSSEFGLLFRYGSTGSLRYGSVRMLWCVRCRAHFLNQ